MESKKYNYIPEYSEYIDTKEEKSISPKQSLDLENNLLKQNLEKYIPHHHNHQEQIYKSTDKADFYKDKLQAIYETINSSTCDYHYYDEYKSYKNINLIKNHHKPTIDSPSIWAKNYNKIQKKPSVPSIETHPQTITISNLTSTPLDKYGTTLEIGDKVVIQTKIGDSNMHKAEITDIQVKSSYSKILVDKNHDLKHLLEGKAQLQVKTKKIYWQVQLRVQLVDQEEPVIMTSSRLHNMIKL